MQKINSVQLIFMLEYKEEMTIVEELRRRYIHKVKCNNQLWFVEHLLFNSF